MNEQSLQFLKDKVHQHPHPVLFATISGAHLYGFASDDSDYDLRGSHILPLKQIVGLTRGKETIDSSTVEHQMEIDLVTHDVAKFFGMMIKNNGYVLEQVMSPWIVQTSQEHEELKSLTPDCLTRHHAHHYLGFARTQWKLVQQSADQSPQGLPRVKPLLYVYRVLLTGIHLMKSGKVECNLEVLNDEARLDFLPDLLHQKRTGTEKQVVDKFNESFHEETVRKLTARLETSASQSQLPSTPTAGEALNDLLIRIRLAHVE